MDLFTYLMAKNGQNTGRDLFSYLLGKGNGGGGTYTTFTGTTLNISNTIKAKIKNFMLNSTELTQDGTPSPDNPIDVNVITGSNNIKITDGIEEQNYSISLASKNLLDFNNITVGKLGTAGTVTVEGDIITFTANNQSVYGVEIDLNDLNLKPNTTYTVSNLYENTGSFGGSHGWRYYDGTSYTGLTQAETYFNFTTGDGTTNKLYFYVGSPITYTGTLTLYNIQLLEGLVLETDIPDYQAYFSPLEYCKIGDYKDQLFKNTADSPYYDNTLIENEWYLKKSIGKYIFTGNEAWLSYGSDVYASNLFLAGISDDLTINGYCNRCLLDTRTNMGYTSNARNGVIIYNLISFWGLPDTTITSWKNYLLNNNLTMYYPLQTPTYIHISQTDYPILKQELDNLYNNAKSYTGTTNITQTNDDLPFNINVDVKVKDV